ncbi:MAG: bifunctional riboflavin kinase/FAD synthetase [Zetaproteobacteria bacterium]|nr:MAG: bifunctional riboflavin kinase/FAD synthetase [Zetaproteobacteria bacterium]
MKIFRSWHAVPAPFRHGAITVGNFDGVHLGHEQIIAETRGHALAVNGPALAVTFEPHPRAILFPHEAPRRLCHLHERLERLNQCGLDAVLLLHFDHNLAAWSAESFVRRLHETLAFRHIHAGYDFAFGHGRSGDASLLRRIGGQLGFTVSIAEAFELEGAVVSSSRIRSAIEAADFKLVERLLGRPYSISGHVGRGDARGRKLGFPTANLNVRDLAHPPAGVYAVIAETRRQRWHGAAYFGYRPTFQGRTLILETHVFDDNPNLYKQRLKVTFVERVREDRAFPNPEALARQIEKDCAAARAILAQRDNT